MEHSRLSSIWMSSRRILLPKIETLVEDIYAVFDKDVTVSPEDAQSFGEELSKVVIEQVSERKPGYLRLSNLGNSCSRQLWYSVNTPELAERMSGSTRIKFLIGHITEAVILFLAKLSGHSVTDEQKEVSLHGVSGHIDALADGELVDVKSASPRSYLKFVSGLKPEQDDFGYINQIGNYGASLGHQRGHFLAADKVSGKLHLDTHEFPEFPQSDLEKKVNDTKEMLASNTPPERSFTDVKDGESGNRKLGVKCSYCAFKHTCWPGIETWQYAGGPRFLTKVVRTPKPTKGAGRVE